MKTPGLVVLFALGATLAGCRSNPPNYYRNTLTKQEACCGRLADPTEKDRCVGEISRVESTAAETSPTNQETFGCIDRYFACDPTTGRATQESAQAQLDCINELESTQQMPR